VPEGTSKSHPDRAGQAGPPCARPGLASLAWGSVAAILLTAGATAIIVLFGRPAWWNGWLAALIASLIATVASLGTLAPTISGGMQSAAYGYLAASVVRMLTALVSCVGAVVVFHAPPIPTLLLTVPLYFAQVATEAVVLGRAFRTRT